MEELKMGNIFIYINLMMFALGKEGLNKLWLIS